jgi:RNA polymerase sigma-70 factor, ECF subfamily
MSTATRNEGPVTLLYAAPVVAPGVLKPHTAAERRGAGRQSTIAGVDDDSDELVARCRGGSAAAFGELFRRHSVGVARLAQRLGVRANDLEDLVQETFVQVHRSLPDFRGQSRFSTWLYRVTVNVVLMYRRSQRSRPQLAEAPPWAPVGAEQLLPDDDVARRRRVQALYRLLDRLSDKKRTVFVLHELEGLAPAEIGKIVSAPVLTVRTRLFYARRELSALMREEPLLAALADELSPPESDAERAPRGSVPHKEPV